MRNPRRQGGAGGRQAGEAGNRRRLEHRVSRRHNCRQSRRQRRGRDRPHRTLWFASYRRNHHRRSDDCGKVPARSRFSHCAAQRVDAICRWRRIWLRCRNRHRHRTAARARPRRRRSTHDIQISYPRKRSDQAVTATNRDMSERLPPHAPGMRIGLFGGTFDPPHQAHLGAALLALKRLRLDRVWWLVTPGNPLKSTRGLAPLPSRIAAARALTNHPRIDVTGLEAVIKTRYTYDTISWLVRRCPGVRFVWVMGADNLRSFHRWQKWRKIAELVPIVVIDRLGPSLYAAASPAGNALSRVRIPEYAASTLPGRKAPVWAFLHGLKSPLSSTALRALRGGQPTAGGRSAASRKSKRAGNRSRRENKRGNRAVKRKSAAKSVRRRGRKKRTR